MGGARESMLLTETGFSIVSNVYLPPEKISWEEIEKVEYINGYYYFFFDLINNKEFKKYERLKITNNLSEDNRVIPVFVEMMNEIASKFENIKKNLKNRIMKEFYNGDFNLAFSLCNEYDNKYGEDTDFWYYKVFSYMAKGEYSTSLNEINHYIPELEKKYSDNSDKSTISEAHRVKATIYEGLNDSYNAIRSYVDADKYSTDHNKKFGISQSIKKNYDNVKKDFFSYPMQNRRLLYIDNDYLDLSPKSFLILLINDLPQIQFPVGHPKSDSFYIIHPYSSERYLPFKEFEGSLLLDKIFEFRRFLQALGATKLSIKFIRGINNEKDTSQYKNKNLNVDIGSQNGNAEFLKSNEEKTIKELLQTFETVQTFTPTKKPYLLGDMLFYNFEQSWQDLYQQRIGGHINSHSETLTSKQSYSLSKNELTNINVEYVNSILEAKGSSRTETNNAIREEETIMLSVNVEFASVLELTE
jgi:hypothetical protein